jgi:hypothetical protein
MQVEKGPEHSNHARERQDWMRNALPTPWWERSPGCCERQGEMGENALRDSLLYSVLRNTAEAIMGYLKCPGMKETAMEREHWETSLLRVLLL